MKKFVKGLIAAGIAGGIVVGGTVLAAPANAEDVIVRVQTHVSTGTIPGEAYEVLITTHEESDGLRTNFLISLNNVGSKSYLSSVKKWWSDSYCHFERKSTGVTYYDRGESVHYGSTSSVAGQNTFFEAYSVMEQIPGSTVPNGEQLRITCAGTIVDRNASGSVVNQKFVQVTTPYFAAY